MQPLVRLIGRNIGPYWGYVALVVLCQTIATAMALYLPTLNARLIDEGVVQGDLDYIWRTGGLMLIFGLVQSLAQIIAVYLGARTAMSLGRQIRAAMFRRTLEFSTQEINHFGAPTLLTRSTNDVQQVQQFVYMSLVLVVGAPITMVGGAVMALSEDAGLAWTIVVAAVFLGLGMGLIISGLTPLFRKMQTRIDVINRIVREQITGIRVIRAFVRDAHEAARFERANTELVDVTLKAGWLMAAAFPFMMLVLNVSSVGVMWFGGHRIDSGDIMVGQLMAFLAYLMQILISVMMTTILLVMAPRSAVSSGRILEVLDTEPSVVDPDSPPASPARQGHVDFEQVSFSYPGAAEPVLADISLQLRPGRVTAIIGSTGCGKTTLVRLIPRLIDVTSGQLTIDGVAVSQLPLAELWQRISLVPQQPYLFSGTVASNLRYGNAAATDDELWQALRLAQAADFVAERPDQLDSPVAQGGTNLSGGQRQRLAIARALAKRAEIYLFDDAFSALDVATDARLRAAIRQQLREATVVIVAQRIASIVDADEIVVLEHGRIVGRGRHAELLQECSTYREIVESQDLERV